MFDTVLVANRGEIAVRVMRTLRRLGIGAVAVYTEGDRDARHVREADVAVQLRSASAARGYLDIEAVVAAAVETGAQAVHPGYGFLAENAAFARACAVAGLVFIGPPPEAIEAMGDKISAKQTVEKAGVPVVPGVHRSGLTDDELVGAADDIGFPVLLKPSAGGGGKGMRQVADTGGMRAAIASARREASNAFGDDTLLVERFVERPRHIEIQVLADAHGAVIHLGERECSLQRRHQKIIEEAPSPLLTSERRAAMGEGAVAAALACGYAGAGTVEFIVSHDRPDEFFFMEMNTRLQVEHPVTELVTGLDLVEEQLRVAAGEPLRITQGDVRLTGHAIEARVYAEDPARDFLPTGGRVVALRDPVGEHIRVDSGVAEGTLVGPDYDPMLAKVVAWGVDRAEAVRRLDRALGDSLLLGVVTNNAFLRALLRHPDVMAGRLDTGLVARNIVALVDPDVPREAVIAAALGRLTERAASQGDGPFETLTGFRIGGSGWTHERLQSAGQRVSDVAVQGRPEQAQVRVDGGEPFPARASLSGIDLQVGVDGLAHRWAYVADDESIWVGREGAAWHLHEVAPRARPEEGIGAAGGPLVAPMPGTVTIVHVAVGDTITSGQPVVAVEAMKMEHVVRATVDGVVTEVLVSPGQAVVIEAPLVVVEAVAAGGPS